MSTPYGDRLIRPGSRFALKKERGGFRTPEAVYDDAPSDVLPFDILEEDGSSPLIRDTLVRERRHVIAGAATRAPNRVQDLQHDPADASSSHYLQSMMGLFASHGDCETVGTSYDPAKSGTITSGQGTTTLTLDITMTIDAHVNDYIEIDMTGGDLRKFVIVSNTTSTVTLDVASPATADGKAYEIFTAPFTHTVSIGKTIPSYVIAQKIPSTLDPGDKTKNITIATLGCLLKTYEISVEGAQNVLQSLGWAGAKEINLSPSFTFPTDFLDKHFYVGSNVTATFAITYNSVTEIDGDNCDMIGYRIETEMDMEHLVGDRYVKRPSVKTYDIAITLKYKPRSLTFFNLVRTDIEDFVTPVNCIFRFQLDADHYIQITCNDLYPEEHPVDYPSKSDFEVGVDAVFRFNPNTAIAEPAIVGVDDLGLKYYEGSYGTWL